MKLNVKIKIKKLLEENIVESSVTLDLAKIGPQESKLIDYNP